MCKVPEGINTYREKKPTWLELMNEAECREINSK